MFYHGSPQRQNCFSASQPNRLGLPPLPYHLLAWRWSSPHATSLYEASHRSGAAAFPLIFHAAPGSRDTQVLPESCSDSAWSPPSSDHLFGGLLHLLPFSEIRTVRCKDCAFYEEFAPKRNGYWNKCALSDLYNLDPYSYRRCPYFVSVEPEYELVEELSEGVII